MSTFFLPVLISMVVLTLFRSGERCPIDWLVPIARRAEFARTRVVRATLCPCCPLGRRCMRRGWDRHSLDRHPVLATVGDPPAFLRHPLFAILAIPVASYKMYQPG
jgi:hypothetical protein